MKIIILVILIVVIYLIFACLIAENIGDITSVPDSNEVYFIIDTIKNEVPIKQKEIQTIFNEHKKELEEIAEKIIKGLITDSDAKYLLRQKERLVKIKLLGLNIKSKITAEKAVNASWIRRK